MWLEALLFSAIIITSSINVGQTALIDLQVSLDSPILNNDGTDWMYMSDSDGNPIKTPINLPPNTIAPNYTDSELAQLITFDLYTKYNPSNRYQLVIDDVEGLKKSNIDFSKSTIMVIHGWMSSNTSTNIYEVKERYMQGDDFKNVIICDWATLSHTIYPLTVLYTPIVGYYVYKFFEFLISNGLSLNLIHLVGHSLGAHICGYAGAAVKNGKFYRITGLDPAMPMYFPADPKYRLDPTDASFVDIIHTCGGVLGYPTNLGTVDCYPNGGTPPQPGCYGPTQMMSGCSHGRSVQIFSESVGNPAAYLANKCDSWVNYQLNQCNTNIKQTMGEDISNAISGMYYLKTSTSSPYHSV